MFNTLEIAKSRLSVAIVVTVLNEAATIEKLLTSLMSQSLPADEIIIVDGGSTDATVALIQHFQKSHTDKISLVIAPGNRSLGRNTGVSRALSELIAFTDAGCQPAANWLAELVEEYSLSKSGVVAGYYQVADEATPFQMAAAPFFLVMPDKINPQKFLPATRSMLIEKAIFLEVNGFDEKLSDNEDYAFARKLEGRSIPISFSQKAVVAWLPPKDLGQFWRTIYRFARGDVQAGLWRPKVSLIFARYGLSLILVLLALQFGLVLTMTLVLGMGLLYSSWAWFKLHRYVKKGHYWLPVMQFAADGAVMTGTVVGMMRRKSNGT